MEPITLQRVEGRTVVNPDMPRLMVGDEPFTVMPSSYWTRRLNDGDVVLVTQKTAEEAAKAAQRATSSK